MPRPWATVALNLLLAAGCLAVVLWALWRSLKRSEDPSLMLFKVVLSLVLTGGLIFIALTTDGSDRLVVPGLCAGYGVTMAIIWGRHIGALVASPLTAMFDGGSEEVEPRPLYSVALNKIRRGEYNEAAFEIKTQLMKFPDDFFGQHLLAQLQAEHLNDLQGAQVTVEKLCAQRGHPPNAIADTLNQLADWHLKYAQDAMNAQVALESIIERFPDTEFAQHAHQRIAHLASQEMLLAAHDRPSIKLRPGIQNLGLMKDSSELQAPEDDPAERARQYVAHLEKHPQDNEMREKLAWIYAKHYGRPDLAIDQMEQILAHPNQTSKHVIHCLNMIADVNIKYANNLEAARAALQRIVEGYPESAAAESARKRIDRLRLEMRTHGDAPSIKLGTYEQNIGLKKGL
jgi:TolA-binding protein